MKRPAGQRGDQPRSSVPVNESSVPTVASLPPVRTPEHRRVGRPQRSVVLVIEATSRGILPVSVRRASRVTSLPPAKAPTRKFPADHRGHRLQKKFFPRSTSERNYRRSVNDRHWMCHSCRRQDHQEDKCIPISEPCDRYRQSLLQSKEISVEAGQSLLIKDKIIHRSVWCSALTKSFPWSTR